jgi:hypothetical protein
MTGVTLDMSREQKDAEANEVELSAEELVEISSAAESARSEAESTTVQSVSGVSRQPTTQPRTTAAAAKRRSNTWRYIVVAAGIVVLAGGASYVIPRDSATAALHSTSQWKPLPEKDPEPIEEPKPVRDLKPVRIRNAFDRNEVFEFPPGTSQQQARDAVAEILLQRAIERQSATTASSG